MINSSLLVASAIALLSIIWVELVRDSYHLVSHLWQPLYRLHSWHHRIFRPDLSVKSEAIYRQANWYNPLVINVGFALALVMAFLSSRKDGLRWIING